MKKRSLAKAPSFVGLKSSSQTASLAKRANRSRGSRCELILFKELRRKGLKFRTHFTNLPGKPDIVFPQLRIAVFCDGDFWHGRQWATRSARLREGSNASYWVAKIEANMRRD